MYMSTCYYLIENKKKQEYDRLINFWGKTLYPKVKELVEKYFEENQGSFINEDTLEEVLDDSSISNLKYCPINDDSFVIKIGTSTAQHFYWSKENIADYDGIIYDLESLEKFLNNNKNYLIYDEYNKIISLETFRDIVSKNKD